MVSIISSLEFHVDEVHGSIGTSDVDNLVMKRQERAVVNANYVISLFFLSKWETTYLHERVVERNKGGEQVQVTCCEHQSKEYLAFPRDSCQKSKQNSQRLHVNAQAMAEGSVISYVDI